MRSITSYINPSYIFAQVEDPTNAENYQDYWNNLGTAKLFLFSRHQSILYIPCLVCESSRPLQLEASHIDVSLATLDILWGSLNERNMHQKTVITRGLYLDLPKCGGSYNRFDSSDSDYLCMVYTASKKYNFTISMYGVGLHISTVQRVLHNDPSEYRECLKLIPEQFKFVIVTSFPSRMDTFEAFISPFDGFTWALILSSCFALGLFIMADHALMDSGGNHRTAGLFNILFPLLGQVSSDNVLPFSIAKQPPPWFG